MRNDLNEFFDDPKHFGAQEVKSGRAWRIEELRIKSNSDLHKLWFVLLKERNMLKTMEHACKEECELFPSPERIDKVEESMDNLEKVVRERNRAYDLLETGEDHERPLMRRMDTFESRFKTFQQAHAEEHPMPEVARPDYRPTNYSKMEFKYDRLIKEKLNKRRQSERRRQYKIVLELMKRFPDLDMEAIKEQYPDVDLETVRLHITKIYKEKDLQ
jgi:large subunit ribosomal protein L47